MGKILVAVRTVSYSSHIAKHPSECMSLGEFESETCASQSSTQPGRICRSWKACCRKEITAGPCNRVRRATLVGGCESKVAILGEIHENPLRYRPHFVRRVLSL